MLTLQSDLHGNHLLGALPAHELAMRQQSGLGGAVLSFDVRGHTP